MPFSFLNRFSLRKITVGTTDDAGQAARTVLEQLLTELPEMLLACLVEVSSGRVLASYTTASALNPNQISLRYAKLLRQTDSALAARQIPGGPLTEMTLLLEDQLHLIRPLPTRGWYCFLAVRFADTNLGMASEILRRQTAQLQ
ncbi:hypothetical protein [Hymenobacter psychrotolerans]|uniref:Roadblock/LAMTOR2 domain-containing protein n=1 Tax=Hymenobacter psychrotolerans DSM 18569 TaxID=1121959 RepID=A0A1M6QGA2_9BACT|nr:hypothetical protein [Hymenobacter psychrotolerans]SHK19083.1 hypothetical protein SAMN02746009_00548 [Hymenobacter psychrotolerans DSM 18569]